ncbi:hypothetical protein D3C74_376410 [compost metagenome]
MYATEEIPEKDLATAGIYLIVITNRKRQTRSVIQIIVSDMHKKIRPYPIRSPTEYPTVKGIATIMEDQVYNGKLDADWPMIIRTGDIPDT